jgi:hypothetical protein
MTGNEMTADDIDPLTCLAIRHGTDKWVPHAYTPIYHSHFAHLREKPIKLLEIGIGGYDSLRLGGQSLHMWAEYFASGQIVGIDICEKQIAPHPRIKTLVGSQDDPEFLREVIASHGPFDLVVDDGSHRPKHVATSFEVLFPSLSIGGFYAIEDVQTAFLKLFGGSPEDGAETMQLAGKQLRDALAPTVLTDRFPTSITNLHAYPNLLIVQRRSERGPVDLRYDPIDAPVAGAIALMERQLEKEPTPDGLAHLAYNLGRERDFAKGLAAISRGLAQWPDHFHLLSTGVWLALRAGDRALHAEYWAQLVGLAPDDALVRKFTGKRGTPRGGSDVA